MEKYEKKILRDSSIFYDISIDDLKFWQSQGFNNGIYLPPVFNPSKEKDTQNILEDIKIKYDTTFDFLESSNEWNANKLKIGQGQYKYICGNNTKSVNKCKNKPMVDGDGKCHLHSK